MLSSFVSLPDCLVQSWTVSCSELLVTALGGDLGFGLDLQGSLRRGWLKRMT
ncbi:MAG TPA: hypothetical protein VL134_08320 [Leptolyngbya sp.]|nr:hypothetical protein [Leptolyngbya sp.]